jgi:hypothetical protein
MAVAVPFIAAAAAAGSSHDGDGAQQRQVGAAQARALEMEASVARRQAGMEEEALRRDTQRQFGELRAAGGQAGLLDSVTFGDVYKQAATAAELDALSLAYQGETQAAGLLTEARITRACASVVDADCILQVRFRWHGRVRRWGWYATFSQSAIVAVDRRTGDRAACSDHDDNGTIPARWPKVIHGKA